MNTEATTTTTTKEETMNTTTAPTIIESHNGTTTEIHAHGRIVFEINEDGDARCHECMTYAHEDAYDPCYPMGTEELAAAERFAALKAGL